MRTLVQLNNNWLFSLTANGVPAALPTDWQSVTLPHTWNGIDGQDGGNDYHRGTGYYAKSIPASLLSAPVNYIQFEGVNSSAEVYWNGEKLTTHHGGYSTFRVKLEDIQPENLLVVTADNSPNEFVYPQNADFTFYGGIYRDVTLIRVDEAHFDLDYFGGPGITVTPIVSGKTATVTVEAFVTAGDTVRFDIMDNAKSLVARKTVPVVDGKASAEFIIENPHLWHGVEDPYLYTAQAILTSNGEQADVVSADFGCRSFLVDPNRGFILNGKAYPLRGVSRHQDRPDIGNALEYHHHKEDIDLILEMGANTIRLAHYQHNQDVYDLCDRKGLILWAEIPYISAHMPDGLDNTVSQMTELIVQNYNHPSIVCWGLSNEITMNGPRDKSLLHNHRVLNDLCHKMDKTRPTTLAVITMCDMTEEYVRIPDIVSYNHYFGWYGGTMDMYGPWFDKFHKKYPNTPIGISEYGCEALDWHTSNPMQGDYTEEYQALYHEELIKTIDKRPYLWATHVWNMFDFAADARAEGGENGMNHKGLVTFDRKYKKDSFYAYKAWLSKDPFVHICGKRYINRAEDVTKVTVYSNRSEVELFANGVSLGKQTKGEFPFFYFEVPLQGEVSLKAVAGDCTDESRIVRVDEPDLSYILQEEGEVLNWFEITAPAGYCCLNDTLGDVMKTLRGKIFVLLLVKKLFGGKKKGGETKQKAPGSGIKLNSTILDMAKGFTVKRILSMVGLMGQETPSKEEMLAINKKLNKIKKK